jgi:hypothetical protein
MKKMNTTDDALKANGVLNFAQAEYHRYQQRLKAWEKVILAHGGTLPRTDSGNKSTSPARKPKGKHASAPRAYNGKMAKIKHFATECIRNSEGHHAHREAIHADLAKHDLHITVNMVSVYLSGWKDTFVPDRQKGWTLTEFAA